MEVTFLGTGTSGGVPLIGCQCEVCKSTDPKDKRLRSSILLRTGNQNIVIDCGPDFRQQMLREDVRTLDALVMTHAHKDHTGGMDDIRAFNFIQQKPVTIYCDYATELGIKEQFSYAFTETDYPYLPKMDFIQIADDDFDINGLKFLPINVIHGKMPVKGYRIGDFTYITDAQRIIGSELDKMRGTKTLIINALRPEPHYSHLSIQQAIDIVEEIKPERAYFIHMSHQFGLHNVVQAQLPAHITVAYDGLKIEV